MESEGRRIIKREGRMMSMTTQAIKKKLEECIDY
jgi:hypothetical protein